jgi:hypothetical protein
MNIRICQRAEASAAHYQSFDEFVERAVSLLGEQEVWLAALRRARMRVPRSALAAV